MFSLLTPKQAFLDAQGNPLSGGRLWTKVSGSNTNKTTFKDADMVVPNTNPIILDSRGEVPFGVFGSTGAYRLILAAAGDLTDPPTSPIWGPRDGVSGINDFVTTSSDEWSPTGLTPTLTSSVSFSVPGDQTLIFEPRRRVRATVGAGFRYGTIRSSTVISSLTNVTIVNDITASVLDSSISAVAVGKVSATSTSQPYDSARGLDIASAGTMTLPANADRFNFTGTTTINAFALSWEGRRVYVTHAGAQALTHGTTFQLPGGTSFLTQINDESVWEQTNPTGTWKMINFMKAGATLAGLTLIDTQIFTSSGTWNKPPGTVGVRSRVQGSGAGAGGAGAGDGSTNSSAGSGGGGGEYAEYRITSGLGATETVIIGAAGVGGDTNGSSGGDSSFGAHVIAKGGFLGAGGVAGTAVQIILGGAGGNGGGGSATQGFRVVGTDGGPSMRLSGTQSTGGRGGGSHMAGSVERGGGNTNGRNGYLYGGGAAGPSVNGVVGFFGGNGAKGIVIVESFG